MWKRNSEHEEDSQQEHSPYSSHVLTCVGSQCNSVMKNWISCANCWVQRQTIQPTNDAIWDILFGHFILYFPHLKNRDNSYIFFQGSWKSLCESIQKSKGPVRKFLENNTHYCPRVCNHLWRFQWVLKITLGCIVEPILKIFFIHTYKFYLQILDCLQIG